MAREMRDSGQVWVGEIPVDWGFERIGAHFSEVTRKNTDLVSRNALKFTAGTIVRKPAVYDVAPLLDTYKTYKVVDTDDMVINCLNLNFDLKSFRVGRVEEPGIITSAYLVLRPDGSYNPIFVDYAFKAFDYRKALHNMGTGIRKTLNWKEFKQYRLQTPPLDTQRRIADYLDAKCAEIDRAIESAERSIEEYEMLRKSYVTGMVKHRDGWNKTRLSHVCSRIFDGPFGSNLKSVDYVDSGIFVVRLENLRYLWFNLEKQSFVTQSKYETISAHTVFPGDLLMSTFIVDSIKVCEMPDEFSFAVNKADCIGIRPKDPSHASWIKYCLASMDTFDYLSGLIHGTTRPRVNTTQIRTIPISMPNKDTRDLIVDSLDKMNSDIDEIIANKRFIIDDLKAYKQSLIYEVVTGKREV